MSTSPETPRRFMTLEQVAEELNVGLPQVRALVRSGELRGLQVGAKGLWRIGVQDLEDFIAEAYARTAELIKAGAVDESSSTFDLDG